MTTEPDDHTLPALRLGEAEVADLELALSGVALPWARLGGSLAMPGSSAFAPPEPGPDARLRLEVGAGPDDVTLALAAGGALLCDRELTPVARLDAVHAVEGGLAGAARAVRRREARLFADRRGARHEDEPVTTAVVAGRPLLDGELDEVTQGLGGPLVVLVPAEGPTPDGLDPTTLMRCVDLSVEDEPDVKVLPVAMAWRDPASDRALAERLGAAHGASRTQLLGDDPRWAAVLGAVRAGTSVPEVVRPRVGATLAAWHRPRHQRGLVVMLTGLSGSGKSTIARDLAQAVVETTPRTVSLLDGDDVRRLLSAGLGFDRESRDLNVRRIGFVAAEVARHGGVAVCAPIAPYAESRAAVRRMVEAVGDFVLVHVSTPLEECERRDLKGLYAKARAGALPGFTGITDPYEAPTDADLAIDTTAISRSDAVQVVLDHLTRGGWLTGGQG